MYCSSLLTILSAKNYTKNKFKEPDLQNRVQVQTEINITETPPAPANYVIFFRLKISVRRHKTNQIRENEVDCVTPENRFERYKFPSSLPSHHYCMLFYKHLPVLLLALVLIYLNTTPMAAAVRSCVIIGGGAAGMSAGVTLVRTRRLVTIIDAGQQSNRYNYCTFIYSYFSFIFILFLTSAAFYNFIIYTFY